MLGSSALHWGSVGEKKSPPSWSQQSEKGGMKTRGISKTEASSKEGAENGGEARQASLSATDQRALEESLRASSGSPKCGAGKCGAFTQSPNICRMPTNARLCSRQ